MLLGQKKHAAKPSKVKRGSIRTRISAVLMAENRRRRRLR
jgi:hypothetical protein